MDWSGASDLLVLTDIATDLMKGQTDPDRRSGSLALEAKRMMCCVKRSGNRWQLDDGDRTVILRSPSREEMVRAGQAVVKRCDGTLFVYDGPKIDAFFIYRHGVLSGSHPKLGRDAT